MLLEALNDIFKDGIQYVYADIAMRDLGRGACLMQERKKLGPCAHRNFNGGDRGNDSRCRVSHEVTA